MRINFKIPNSVKDHFFVTSKNFFFPTSKEQFIEKISSGRQRKKIPSIRKKKIRSLETLNFFWLYQSVTLSGRKKNKKTNIHFFLTFVDGEKNKRDRKESQSKRMAISLLFAMH
jgi:hypothetical protein